MSALLGRDGAGRGVVRRAARGDCYHKEAGHVVTCSGGHVARDWRLGLGGGHSSSYRSRILAYSWSSSVILTSYSRLRSMLLFNQELETKVREDFTITED